MLGILVGERQTAEQRNLIMFRTIFFVVSVSDIK